MDSCGDTGRMLDMEMRRKGGRKGRRRKRLVPFGSMGTYLQPSA